MSPLHAATSTKIGMENSKEVSVESIKDMLARQQRPWLNSKSQDQNDAGDTGCCPICRGARFVHPLKDGGRPDYSTVVPCECVRERLERERLARMLKLCELPVGTQGMTFEGFKKRPGLDEAYEACLSLAEGRADYCFLTLWSDTGRGKTHLGIATVRRWLNRGIPARYVYVPLLLEELRRGFRAEGDMSYERRFDFYLNVPLLMLDDLGVESSTKWVQEKLDTIVDYRLKNNLFMLVTTNLTMDELDFRIASRLQRRGRVIVIDAPEYA